MKQMNSNLRIFRRETQSQLCVCVSDECVPLGCMMINSVARLCPLLQPASLYSLPNAPSLSDLDWEENDTDDGKPNLSESRLDSNPTVTPGQVSSGSVCVHRYADSNLMNEMFIG